MSHVLRVGVADQIGYFRAFNDDGSGKTDLTSSTTGLALTVFRVGLAEVSIASLSAKAADNTTHADGAIRAVGGNLYTVDLPDAACATQCLSIGVRGTYTGGVIEPIPHPMVGYNPATAAVGANTVAPATPTNVSDAQVAILAKLPAALVGGRIDASVGAMATDVLTAASLATDAVSEIQSGLATASNLAAVAGYLDTEIASILEDTGTTIPAQITALNNLSSAQVASELGTGTWATALPWNAAWDAEVQSECTDALAAYDPPTKAELDSAVSTLATSSALATVDAVADSILVEIGKVPRGASAITAGGNATRTKVSANGTTLVEAIT